MNRVYSRKNVQNIAGWKYTEDKVKSYSPSDCHILDDVKFVVLRN